MQAICLSGPTAAGKTAVALAFAQQLPLEIVSVDSALVFRGMDIGTAKPNAAERAAVPHHLIDILDPAESYSAARFVAEAEACIAAINARGRLALLTGGTLLYLHALQHGIDPMPAADAALRAQIDAEAALHGWPALHAELARIDPTTAARLGVNDSQRIQRALEVYRLSGRALSAWHSARGSVPQPPRFPLVSLEPQDRSWLHARIADRFDTMLAAGFVDEVRRLRARPDLHAGLPSMRCVGYRQIGAALDRGALEAVRETAIAATRQLAKRQLTWLRSMPHREPVPCDSSDVLDRAVQALHRAAQLAVHGTEFAIGSGMQR